MIDFEILLQEEVQGYDGPYAELVRYAPAFYTLLSNLLRDPNLPGRLRPLILAGIGYFALPGDILPEDLHGPAGYIDDLYVSARVADRVRRELGSSAILLDNWEAEQPLLPLVERILGESKDMLGEQMEIILWFLGYEYF